MSDFELYFSDLQISGERYWGVPMPVVAQSFSALWEKHDHVSIEVKGGSKQICVCRKCKISAYPTQKLLCEITLPESDRYSKISKFDEATLDHEYVLRLNIAV